MIRTSCYSVIWHRIWVIPGRAQRKGGRVLLFYPVRVRHSRALLRSCDPLASWLRLGRDTELHRVAHRCFEVLRSMSYTVSIRSCPQCPLARPPPPVVTVPCMPAARVAYPASPGQTGRSRLPQIASVHPKKPEERLPIGPTSQAHAEGQAPPGRPRSRSWPPTPAHDVCGGGRGIRSLVRHRKRAFVLARVSLRCCGNLGDGGSIGYGTAPKSFSCHNMLVAVC